ncbi:hypothetical protein Ssi03_01880 [Sphaerisporangium siamense]|nr:hypothetical protein Ssi03_01880 [Sphaerisporangium siamense]
MVSEVRGHLRRNAERAPDAVAVRSAHGGREESVTWPELGELADKVAAGVAGRRFRGPVTVVVDNSVASVATVLGFALAAADVALVERESSYLLDEDSVLRRVGSGRVVCPPEAVEPLSARGYTCLSFAELADGAGLDGLDGTVSSGRVRDAEVLQMTSGSSGRPKAARQTVRNVLRGGELYRDAHRVTAADTIVAPMSLSHSFPLVGGLATALVSGASLRTMTRFATGALVESLEEATVLLGTPLLFRMLNTVLPRDRARTRLRLSLSSGGPLPPDVAEGAVQRLGAPVHQVYGSTETGLIACQYDREEPWPAGCVGTVADGVEFRVEHEDDGPVVLWRTGTMFLGYAGTSAGGPRPDGFHRSGDHAEVDERGHVFLTGRKDTFVNVGGRKVNPERVEQVLAAHPGVVEVCVYGALNDFGEQEVRAALVLRAGTAASDVVASCRERLMPYEVPHRVREMAALPRTSMGKIDRRGLRSI